MPGVFKRISRYHLAFSALALVVIVEQIFMTSAYQHYTWLANSFLHGRLDIPYADFPYGWISDTVIVGGRFYWPLGPLPAVLLTPFVAVFGQADFLQPLLQILIVLGLVYVCFRLAKYFAVSAADAAWLAIAFVFASVTVGCVLVNCPWQIGDTLAALSYLLAAYLYLRGRSLYAVGALCGAAAMSRYTAALGIIFFIVAELRERKPWREQGIRLAKLAAPFVFCGLLLLLYDAARFGNPFDTGHSHHFLYPGAIKDRLAYGVFNLRNVGRNAYYYFLKLPEWAGHLRVSPLGLSFFILSPIFIYAFFARRAKYFWPAVAVTVPALVVSCPTLAPAADQVGPRYLVEILPFWYLVLIEYFKTRGGLSEKHKTLIAASTVLNIILFSLMYWP